MPNIEIHGLRDGEIQKVHGDIAKIMKKYSFYDQVVVTICHTPVYDLGGKPKSYLRVFSTDEPYLGTVVTVLKGLKIDIEVVLLSGFHPKDE